MSDLKLVKRITIDEPKIDWITLTTYEPTAWHFWRSCMEPLAKKCRSVKEDVSVLQYTGYQFQYDDGHVFIGSGFQRGNEHIMLRASGEIAHQLFPTAAAAGMKQGWLKCTRIDLQVTTIEPDGWNQWHAFNRLKKAGQNVNYVSSRSGIDRRELATVYIGSRHSARFGRMYEKQTHDGTVCLRYEIEFKGGLARTVASDLLENPDKTRFFLAYEVGRRKDKKIESAYSSVLGDHAEKATPYEIVNIDGRRNWLVEQVLPAFREYINRHDADQTVAQVFIEALRDCYDADVPVYDDNPIQELADRVQDVL